MSSNQRPPALPSRLRKPGMTSPQKSTTPPIPITVNGNVRHAGMKAAAPLPPPIKSPALQSPSHYAVPLVVKSANGSPSKRSEYQTPIVSNGMRTVGASPSSANRSLPGAPLSTSSPKLGARTNASIGNNVISLNIRVEDKNGSDSVHAGGLVNHPAGSPHHRKPARTPEKDNGSLDSGSFEQDSLDGSTEFDLSNLMGQSEQAVNRVISRLAAPLPAKPGSGRPGEEEELLEAARERLINESRQFVTASKMFVKSVTDSPQAMAVCLSQCVVLVERMGLAVEDVSVLEQNRDLPPKVRDVARAFLHTLRAAAEASGQGVSDPSMGRLMGKATALAGVLTILMRSLRP